jgi:hypothetical protein
LNSINGDLFNIILSCFKEIYLIVIFVLKVISSLFIYILNNNAFSLIIYIHCNYINFAHIMLEIDFIYTQNSLPKTIITNKPY